MRPSSDRSQAETASAVAETDGATDGSSPPPISRMASVRAPAMAATWPGSATVARSAASSSVEIDWSAPGWGSRVSMATALASLGSSQAARAAGKTARRRQVRASAASCRAREAAETVSSMGRREAISLRGAKGWLHWISPVARPRARAIASSRASLEREAGLEARRTRWPAAAANSASWPASPSTAMEMGVPRVWRASRPANRTQPRGSSLKVSVASRPPPATTRATAHVVSLWPEGGPSDWWSVVMPQKTCTRRAPLVGRVRADANPVAWTFARPVYKSVISFPQNTPNRKPEVSAGHHQNCADNTQIRHGAGLWNCATPLWNY